MDEACRLRALTVHQDYRQMNIYFSLLSASVAKGLHVSDSHPGRGLKDAHVEYGSIEMMGKIRDELIFMMEKLMIDSLKLDFEAAADHQSAETVA